MVRRIGRSITKLISRPINTPISQIDANYDAARSESGRNLIHKWLDRSVARHHTGIFLEHPKQARGIETDRLVAIGSLNAERVRELAAIGTEDRKSVV